MTSSQTHLTWTASVPSVFQNDLQRICALLLQRLEDCQRPRIRDEEWMRRLQNNLEAASVELRSFMGRFSKEIPPALEQHFLEMQKSFDAYRAAFQENARPSLRELRKKYRRMAAHYELTLHELKALGHRSWVGRGHVKPVNYWRNLFHAINATIAFSLYQWVLTREQALLALGSVAVVATLLEVSRRFSERWNSFLVDRVFGLVSRPLERHAVNSATWYLFSLLISCFLFSKEALLVAVLILGYSDPIASIVGKKLGTRKIRGQKSLQGTLAFFLSALAVAVGYGTWMGLSVFSGASWIWYLGVPLTTTAAELFGDRIDDNFGILLAGGAVASLSLALL
jgi:diacylglycerol kinase (CTP)